MNRIAGIIDMDGFTIERKFYCKELGILELGKTEATSHIFDLGVNWTNLSKKDKTQCLFLISNIHKLPFYTPIEDNPLPLEELDNIVEDFYKNVKTSQRDIVAYKGGIFERDLLKKLKIPSINLEQFGCPRCIHLLDKLVWLETCNHHTSPNCYEHCAKIEVEAFGAWVREELSWDS